MRKNRQSLKSKEEFDRKQQEQEKIEKEKQHQLELAEQKRKNDLQSKRLSLLLPFNPSGTDVDMATLWNLEEDVFEALLQSKKKQFEANQLEQQRLAEEKRLADIELDRKSVV